ncbi:MAG: isopentenyl-diphosphate Delta-isomerase [Gemmatimonadota bacterium]
MTNGPAAREVVDGQGAASGSGASTGSPPVVLVDERDQEIGIADKLAAHERGLLHRAVSVFAFNAAGALLLQRRAGRKYHSGGLWSNSACTHPRPQETNEAAARRCMLEELGVSCAILEPACIFTYRAEVSPILVEHELDHVFVARVTEPPSPNADEVETWRAVSLVDAERECADDSSRFSAWFPLALARLLPLEVTARATRVLGAIG